MQCLYFEKYRSLCNSVLFCHNFQLSQHPGNHSAMGRGDGSDFEMEHQTLSSQSQDCEPTPPLQKHCSKTNFFLPQQQPQPSIYMGQDVYNMSGESPLRKGIQMGTRSSSYGWSG